jgi:hypothetical protein
MTKPLVPPGTLHLPRPPVHDALRVRLAYPALNLSGSRVDSLIAR